MNQLPAQPASGRAVIGGRGADHEGEREKAGEQRDIAIAPLRAADGAAMSTDPTRMDVVVGVMTEMVAVQPSSDLPSLPGGQEGGGKAACLRSSAWNPQ